jgi:uncharacterized short protein YbdD (DUF466 family)
MRRWLRVFSNQLRDAIREWAGDNDYHRYLRRCREQHMLPLDRGRYFARRLEERYRSTSRCC